MNTSHENSDELLKTHHENQQPDKPTADYPIKDNVLFIADPDAPVSLFERLLNPKAVQWMMVCGGAVLVIGFVGWLWSMGLFENPVTVALAIGGATLGTMAAGIGLFRMTEHKQAGAGLTLLACLAMPLNLWFYNAQGLITLADGGHLWIPAAICCGIYAMIARTLRQPMFVFTLVGGIVMTGLLFLADQNIGRFFELLSPVTFLVTTGWLCIFSTRLFPQEEGDFSRDKFGRAFQYSGVLVLLGGLVVLAGGQLAGQMNNFLFSISELPAVTHQFGHKLWALAVVSVSAVGCLIQFTLKENSRFKAGWQLAAGLLGVWAAVTLVDAMAIQITMAHLSILVAGTLVGSNLMSRRKQKQLESEGVLTPPFNMDLIWLSTLFVVGMAIFQFIGQFAFASLYPFFISKGWVVVVQLAVTAAACWSVPLSSQKFSSDRLRECLFQESLASILMTLAVYSAVLLFEPTQFVTVAVAMFAMPVTLRFVLNPRLTIKGGLPLTSPAAASAITAVACLFVWMLLGSVVPSLLQWSAVLAVVAVCCLRTQYRNAVDELAGFLAGTCSAVLLLNHIGWVVEIALPLSMTGMGLLMAVINKVRMASQSNSSDEVIVAVQPLPAGLMMLGGGICGILVGLSRTAAFNVDANVVYMLAAQLIGVGLAAWMTTDKNWRGVYQGLAIATIAAAVLALNSWIEIHVLHRLEIGSIVVGLTTLIFAHIGWAREGQKADKSVTTSLWIGSLAIAVPVGLGLIVYRTLDITSGGWLAFHEIAAVVTALSLIAAGVCCQIRSTTLTGAGLLSVYILSLVTLLRLPDQLQSASVIMMVGGGLFFATSVLLSIYRDRLQKLPEQIRQRKGIFRVMKWR